MDKIFFKNYFQNDQLSIPDSSDSVTRVRVIFTTPLSLWWPSPIRLHTKKWTYFAALMMIKIGPSFLFWLPSRAMLHFKDQVSPTCSEVDLRPVTDLLIGQISHGLGPPADVLWRLIINLNFANLRRGITPQLTSKREKMRTSGAGVRKYVLARP